MSNSKKANKQDRRYMRTERAIRAAFLKLAETTEIGKISVSALAREADIDRKTFYLHYASIEELIEAEIQESVEILAQKLKESVSGSNAGSTLDIFKELSTYLALDVPSMQKIAAHLSLEEQLKRMEQPLTDAIIKKNVFNLNEEIPHADYYVTFLAAGLLAVYRRWLLTNSDIPLEEISVIARSLIKAVYGCTKGLVA